MPCVHLPRRHQGIRKTHWWDTSHCQGLLTGGGSSPPPVLYILGRAGLSGSILTLGWLGLCHTDLCGRSAGTGWQTPGYKSLRSIWTPDTVFNRGRLASRPTPLHSPGVQDGHAQAGFRQKQVISLTTFTVTFTCAEVVSALCHSVPPPPRPPLQPSTSNLLSITVSR